MPEVQNEDPASFNATESGLKLAMTIRHQTTGDRYANMKLDFKVSHDTIYLCAHKVF